MRVKAKKSLGQNFLLDKNIIKKIVSCGEINGNDIMEVGPWTGNLTSEIIKEKPNKLFLVEKDTNLMSNLKKVFSDEVVYINKDILDVSERELSKNKLIVFGNLPYNISTEILTKWILNINSNFWFDKLILMFQKEVAERIISKPNLSSYGRLSIISNWKLHIEKIIDIKPESFRPKPKVDSSLLILTPKKNFFNLKSGKSLETVTRTFFNQRRKKIKRPFNQLFTDSEKIANKLNISLDLRPQNLDFDKYYLIAKEFENLRD